MKQVKAKIYYLVATGDILVITSEMQGDIIATTKEQDMTKYDELKDKSINEVDFIELEYGTLGATFNNIKSYSVNLKTKKLKVTYYTQEELLEMQKQYEQQNQKAQDLNSRVSDISTYLANTDETTIADIENAILKKELNKINGGM